MTRRRALLLAALCATTVLPARGAATPRLLAAWDRDGRSWLGVLAAQGAAALAVEAAVPLPTRGHGLLAEAGGSVLVVARRPGDWIARWRIGSGAPLQTAWIEPDRAFNGHVLASADGARLYTTETDLASGLGLVGVRDAHSFAKLSEWPTAGCDPHALAWDAQGRLLVANGGVATRPETGRVKRRGEPLDASLVRLDARRGHLLGQWRLADRWLSLRHLAVRGGQLGIALQAEHVDAAERAVAPVLALFDGTALRPAETPRPLAGYGGDIAATGDGRFVVSCPRAGGLAAWDARGRWAGYTPLAEGCALAALDGTVWAGGREDALRLAADDRRRPLPPLRLDNHWAALRPG